ncbi:unnamed protein product, partial [Nesidiocoris tenuis]
MTIFELVCVKMSSDEEFFSSEDGDEFYYCNDKMAASKKYFLQESNFYKQIASFHPRESTQK